MTRQAADRLGVKPLASIIGKYKSSYKWKIIVITSIQYNIMIVVIINFIQLLTEKLKK